jgi:hypothetical protein
VKATNAATRAALSASVAGRSRGEEPALDPDVVRVDDELTGALVEVAVVALGVAVALGSVACEPHPANPNTSRAHPASAPGIVRLTDISRRLVA